MLTQRNLVANAVGVTDAVAAIADEIRLCLLPLSHIYARTCDLYSWIYRGTQLVLAESRDTILRDCQLARPTVINAVPYFYQKVADGLATAGSPAEPGALLAAFGGAVKRCYCGGAGLAPETEQFFAERELPILCGYGLTEASPVVTATTFETYTAGTVGQPLPNVEVRLADDGELQAGAGAADTERVRLEGEGLDAVDAADALLDVVKDRLLAALALAPWGEAQHHHAAVEAAVLARHGVDGADISTVDHRLDAGFDVAHAG
jgi:acyl-CoA synthetase (AMP-forming)/AMP-acid ligase II